MIIITFISLKFGIDHQFNTCLIMTCLSLCVPLISGSNLHIKISYQTSQTASASQFLTPEQTAGKKYPYFYTQCQVNRKLSLTNKSQLIIK